MTHGSLFSGIGGFDLAADMMGWENVFHCEIQEFCRKILNYHFPNSTSYEDIKKTDFNVWRGRVSVLSGGFPCQPYSVAGKKLGKEDDRHLWPQMLRAIKEIQPRWVVGENVHGLINWSDGLVFHEVQADLEAEGYSVFPYVLPAVSVNAVHRRDRIFFVAHANFGPEGQSETKGDHGKKPTADEQKIRELHSTILDNGLDKVQRTASDTKRTGLETRHLGSKQAESWRRDKSVWPGQWDGTPIEPPVCCADDGIPRELDGISFSKWRIESIRGYGNAIVPQVVLQIFKTIKEYERLQT